MIPQSSLYGSLLFSIFTGDLPPIPRILCSINMYADDTQLSISSSLLLLNDLVQQMNLNLKLIKQYSDNNALVLNPNKTVRLFTGFPSACSSIRYNVSNSQVVLNDVTIMFSDKVRNLGVTCNNSFSFNAHVNKICSVQVKIITQV